MANFLMAGKAYGGISQETRLPISKLPSASVKRLKEVGFCNALVNKESAWNWVRNDHLQNLGTYYFSVSKHVHLHSQPKHKNNKKSRAHCLVARNLHRI